MLTSGRPDRYLDDCHGQPRPGRPSGARDNRESCRPHNRARDSALELGPQVDVAAAHQRQNRMVELRRQFLVTGLVHVLHEGDAGHTL